MVKIVVTNGKRKAAVAKVRVKKGETRIRINNVPLNLYIPELARFKILEAIEVIGKEFFENLDISAKVTGGGIMSQADAVRIAISRAINDWAKKPALRSKILQYDRTLLAGEPRRKEEKKSGRRGARARRQKSYR